MYLNLYNQLYINPDLINLFKKSKRERDFLFFSLNYLSQLSLSCGPRTFDNWLAVRLTLVRWKFFGKLEQNANLT